MLLLYYYTHSFTCLLTERFRVNEESSFFRSAFISSLILSIDTSACGFSVYDVCNVVCGDNDDV